MSVFISYRRADSGYVTDRIYKHLVAECDEEAVFRDLESIPPGKSIRQHIGEALAKCNALLAVIGPQWLTIADENGCRRLDDPGDYVRIEIETALARGIPVIPVLIEGVPVPNKLVVPQRLSLLSDQQAVVLRRGLDFERDMDRLVDFLRSGGFLRVIRNDPPGDLPFGSLGMF
jgi:hypothetical protein